MSVCISFGRNLREMTSVSRFRSTVSWKDRVQTKAALDGAEMNHEYGWTLFGFSCVPYSRGRDASFSREGKENTYESSCVKVWKGVGQVCEGWRWGVDKVRHSRFSSLHQQLLIHLPPKKMKMKDPTVDLTQLLISHTYIFHRLRRVCKYECMWQSIADEKERVCSESREPPCSGDRYTPPNTPP